jgi:hypothetical protein
MTSSTINIWEYINLMNDVWLMENYRDSATLYKLWHPPRKPHHVERISGSPRKLPFLLKKLPDYHTIISDLMSSH